MSPDLAPQPSAQFPGWVERFDSVIDERWAKWRDDPVLSTAAAVLSQLGDRGLIWLLIAVAHQGNRQRRRRSAKAIAFTGVVAPLAKQGMRRAVKRARPDSDAAPPWLRKPTSSGFPSGHTLAAFCAARILARDDSWGPVYYLAAISIGASRLHTRHHFASDVIAGAALGWIAGSMGLLVIDRPRPE